MIKGRTRTADGDAPAVTARPQRRPKRAALFFGALLIAAVLALAAAVPGAWRATQRREATLPQLEAEARLHPEDGPLQALLGGRLMQAGGFPAAAAALRLAWADGEKGEVVWQALAAANAASGQTRLAQADLRLGIKALPNSARLQTALVQCEALGPNASPGTVAVTISPEGPAPLVALYGQGSLLNGVVSWWGRHHPDQSGFTTRQEWATRRPNDPQVLRLWGLALTENQRLPEAETVLRRALSLAPASPEINLALADVLRQEGHLQSAVLFYLATLKLRPNWLPAVLGLGADFGASGLNAYQVGAASRATEIAPNSADAWIALGEVLRKTSASSTKAAAAYEKAVKLAPNRTDFLDSYAEILNRLRQGDQAQAVLRRRLAAVPDDALAHALLGRSLMDNSRTAADATAAETETREALRLAPGNFIVEAQLGELLLERGQAADAVQALLASLAGDPYNRNGMLLLSRAARRAGRTALADQASRQAAVLFHDQERVRVLEEQEQAKGSDLTVRQQLADLYDRIGEPRQAQRERTTIAQLKTNSQSALKNSRELERSINSALGR